MKFLQISTALALLISAASSVAAVAKAAAPAPAAAAPAAPAGGCPAVGGIANDAALYGPAMTGLGAAPGGKQALPPIPPELAAAGVTAWPTMDVPPPTKQAWFRKVDISKCPTSPPRATVGACPLGLSATQDAKNPTCAWSCGGCTAPVGLNLLPDWTTCPNAGDWGLSFDDGPASLESGNLLNNAVSPTNGIKAQMFIVGSRVVEFPDTLKLEYNAGHVISGHTWSHTALTTQTSDAVVAEFLWTEKIIESVIGKRIKYFRPPYGDVDNRVRCIAQALYGTPAVIWSVDTGDFDAGAPGFNANAWIPGNFTQWVKTYPATTAPGPMSLNHDIHIAGVKTMPANLCILRKAGYNPKPPTACHGDTTPYLDSTTPLASAANGTGTPASGGAPAAAGNSAAAPSTAAAANGTAAHSAGSSVVAASSLTAGLFAALLAGAASLL